MLLLHALASACGTETDVAARSQAASCGEDTSAGACAADAGPEPWTQAPDPPDTTATGTFDPCPDSPQRGECRGLEGAMCRYGDVACGCFAGLWWCAENVRDTAGQWPGPGHPDGSGSGTSPCPAFPPPPGSPCYPGIRLECRYPDLGQVCHCSEGTWRC